MSRLWYSIYMRTKFRCPHCDKVIDDSEVAKYFGSKGGQNNTHEHMVEISKMAVKKRQEEAKKKQKRIVL